jgi:hypothetical protein
MLRTIALAVLVSLGSVQSIRATTGGDDKATVFVEADRSSAFIHIMVNNHRRIGQMVIEVKDSTGKVLYREEGKAFTEELVRRLDKGLFPRTDLTVTVTARDFTIAQQFSLQ